MRTRIQRSGLPSGSSVKVYDLSDSVIYPGILYAGETGGTSLANPFISSDGTIDMWVQGPADLKITFTPSGGKETHLDNVLVDGEVASGGGSGDVVLPEGGGPSQVLAKVSGEDGDVAWVDPVDSVVGLVEWSASPLVYSENFLAGVPGSPWSQVNKDAPFETAAIATAAAAGPPAYDNLLRIWSSRLGALPNAVDTLVSLDEIAALDGKIATRIKFWWSLHRSGTSPATTFSFKEGATTRITLGGLSSNGRSPWAQADLALGGLNTDLNWELSNTSATGTPGDLHVAGVEIYGTADPYMLNKIVTYEGSLYRSTQNNNPYTPGSGSGWVAI